MIQELEKAKQILNKPFCLMQWQAEDAKKRNEEPMGAEDIRYLLSLSISREECSHYDRLEKDWYDTEELFSIIEDAKQKGHGGVWMIGATLNAKDGQRIRDAGYFVRIKWLGSTPLDEIYFSEESYLKARVADFQNFFGDIRGMVRSNVI